MPWFDAGRSTHDPAGLTVGRHSFLAISRSWQRSAGGRRAGPWKLALILIGVHQLARLVCQLTVQKSLNEELMSKGIGAAVLPHSESFVLSLSGFMMAEGLIRRPRHPPGH